MTATIEVSGLCKRFERTTALDEVDLDLGPGVVGLLGPNGSGKSTLLRILGTVLAPDAGHVRLLGHDPTTSSGRLAVRRRLGYLPQEPGLYPGFTAFDLVDYVAVLKELTDRDRRREEVRRVLEAVGLTDVMHKKVRKLSGGTRHRVAIAAALLGAPPLLVLDEPGEGLDPEHRLQLRSVLSDAGRTGTVVVSTHQTTEVAALCREVVVLLRGRVRFTGTPAALAAQAEGRVWLADRPDPRALTSWVTAEGATRNIGVPPPQADLVPPTLDDGYLLVAHADADGRLSASRSS